MDKNSRKVSRRRFLMYVSALSPLFVFGGRAFNRAALAETPEATSAPTEPSALDCIAAPSFTEGPYFVDEKLNRSDIRIDPSDNSISAGVSLKLIINILGVKDNACTPVNNAQIDIWHCDAEGRYSDESANNTVGKKFLRGYQLTDAKGQVIFTTIYPGWYRGRTVHIHLKVRTFSADQKQSYAFNTQLFFDDDLSDQILSKAPYNTRGQRDTRNSNDMVFLGRDQGKSDPEDLGAKMIVKLTKDGDGYTGQINIGVDFSKPSAQPFSGPGGPDAGGPGPRLGTPPATPGN